MLTLKGIALVCALVAAPPRQGNNRNSQIDTGLQAQFDKVDLDHDGYLDRSELTRFYRGAKAKPVEGNMYDDMGNLSPLYYKAQRKYPELIFLWTVDTDSDGRLSWPEYRVWGEKRVAALQQQQQALQQALQKQQRAYQQALRSASRRAVRGNNYNRRAGANYNRQRARQARNAQRNYAAQQRQVQRQIQNQQRAQAAAQRAFQAAVRRQFQAQQQRANYIRSRVAAFYRTPRRHSNPRVVRRRR